MALLNVGVHTSKAASGTQTAPVAFTSIATVNVDSNAYYEVEVIIAYGATAEATTSDNFQLVLGTVAVVDNLLAPVGVNNWVSPAMRFRVFTDENTQLKISSGAVAGSVGSIYKAFCSATRIQ